MIDYALDYDNKVLSGKITACKDIKLACKVDKLSRKKTKDQSYPFYYDKKIVDRFISLAKVISKYKLAPFQLWWLSIVQGFRFKSNPRIIKNNTTILSMARKNAKSYLSAVALLTTLIDSEIKGKQNRQYYIVASKKSIALLTLRTCRALLKRLQNSSKLARNFKLNKDVVYSTVTESYIKALPSRSSSLDGLRVDGCILDECHSLRSNKLRAVLQSATMQSPGSVIYMTSTSGFSYSCPFHKDWEIAEKELEDEKTDSRSFNAIFTMDSTDEIYKNPKSWIKSNPLMSISSLYQSMRIYLKDQLNKATVSGRSNNVLVKNFNTWGTTEENNFVTPQQWKANIVKPIDLDNRSNVILGLDLSRIHDITALSLIIALDHGKYYTDTHGFISDNNGKIQQKSKADKVDYLALEKANYVTICRHSYGLIDYRVVVQYIRKFIQAHDLKDVVLAYDPWQAGDVVQMLGSDPNISLVKVSQSVMNLTNSISWLYRLIVSHKLLHPDNPLYDYAFSNLQSTYDLHGNIYLDKSRYNNKIDNAFALVDSLSVQKSLQNQNKNNLLSKELDNNNFTF